MNEQERDREVELQILRGLDPEVRFGRILDDETDDDYEGFDYEGFDDEDL
jgi:hypothetical protein